MGLMLEFMCDGRNSYVIDVSRGWLYVVFWVTDVGDMAYVGGIVLVEFQACMCLLNRLTNELGI